MERWGKNIAAVSTVNANNQSVCEETNAVLRELVELLEDYAPIWYTEDLHNRVSAALGEFQPAV